jgi:hypothetical protein
LTGAKDASGSLNLINMLSDEGAQQVLRMQQKLRVQHVIRESRASDAESTNQLGIAKLVTITLFVR